MATNAVVIFWYFMCEEEDEMKRPILTDRKGAPLPPMFLDWNHVCWGTHGAMGRIPTGLRRAAQLDATKIVFSVGSALVVDERGSFIETEANRAERFMRGCLPRLKKDFPGIFEDGPFRDQDSFSRWIESVAVFENESVNTSTFFEKLSVILRSVGSLTNAEFVSSCNHLPRIMRDAFALFREKAPLERVQLHFTPADTSYGRKKASDVIVLDLGREPVAWAVLAEESRK